MFRLLKKDSWQIFWIVFHAGIGLASVYTKWALVGWFYVMVLSALAQVFNRQNLQHTIIYLLGYSMGVEVLARGVHASPYIPDQMGKYLAVILFGFGLALGGPIRKVSLYGVIMLLLSLPGLAIAPEYTRGQIVFNYFGPLALFLGVIFCSRQIMTFVELKQLIRMIVLPIFSLACFTFFKASTFDKIEYGVGANFDASGGSITNQVSTLFGTAICLMFLMHLTRQTLFRFKAVDIFIIAVLSIRGLLTFSRGGMLSALIAIVAIIIFPKAKAAWQDSEITLRNIKMGPLLIGSLMIVIIFLGINSYTNNYLLYRYQGKTERAIQSGFEEKTDLDQISSGRWTIFLSDVGMFMAYPALGVGVGHSMIVRHEFGGPRGHASHLELSRLLAEHGIPGLALIILIYIYPFYRAWREPNNYRKSAMLVFLIMGLTATFHSAMRTMSTPLLFSFAFINFVPTNYDWRAHLAIFKKSDKPGTRKRSKALNPPEAVAG